MPVDLRRLILAPAVLSVAAAAGACGASPTAPPAMAAAGLSPGRHLLMIYGTSTCLSGGTQGGGGGSANSSATLAIDLLATSSGDVWRVSMPGQSLTGEIALVNGQVQGWLRGTAMGENVRLSTGDGLSDAIAMESATRNTTGYEGPVLAGTPRYEGVGSASGLYMTCASNGFTLRRA